MFGVPFTLAVIGNSIADGGLVFTLANYTSIILGECINFPLQRNVTFRSKGPIIPQIAFHALGTIGVMLVMNLFTCIWNPVTAAIGNAGHEPVYLYLESRHSGNRNSGRSPQHCDHDRDGRRCYGHHICCRQDDLRTRIRAEEVRRTEAFDQDQIVRSPLL